MISHFFIDRPIFASVLSIVFVLAGGVAVFTLPVAQYPDITPPTVLVTAHYPGANAQTVRDTVGVPIEEQVSGVEGMIYMSSTSANDGSYTLTVTFKLGMDSDMAQVLVQNRVSLALPVIPTLVQTEGINVQKMSPSTLMIVNLVSPDQRYDSLFLSNYATIYLKDELNRLPGVAGISYLGQRDYSLRAWLDPDKMAALGIDVSDIITAIGEQNLQVAAGMIGQPPAPKGQQFELTVNTLGRLTTPEQFGDIVIKAAQGNPLVQASPTGLMATAVSGSTGQSGNSAQIGQGSSISGPQTTGIVRLRDVVTRAPDGRPRVELGAQQYEQSSTLDGQPSVALSIYQLPSTNALATAKGIYAKMDELKTRFPDGLDYRIVYDTTPFIRESVNEVFLTLRDAIILVAIVVLVFLQNWRAALIPLIAVPVAIVGSFAVMAALGYSLNNLSLFGLVLAIGIVVDDAIVVVENVERWLEQGIAPRDAARKAMDEVTGPVIAVALVLCAVFVPCAFLGGVTGQFFRQFAVTIAVSTVISAFNSLTLSPALAALLLKPRGSRRDPMTWLLDTVLGWFFRLFNRVFGASTALYVRLVGGLLRVSVIALVVYAGLLVLTYFRFVSAPTGFIPQQDKGYLLLNVQLPDSASVERTQKVMAHIERIAHDTRGVDHTVGISGQSLILNANAPNFGSLYVMLQPFAERQGPSLSADAIAAALRQRCQQEVRGAIVSTFGAPPIDGLGTTGGFKLIIEDRGNLGLGDLQRVSDQIVTRGNQTPGLTGLFNSSRASTPWLYLDIDRTKCMALGIPVSSVFNVLQVYLGSYYVNNFNEFGRIWQVNVQADPRYRDRVADIKKLQVRNNQGQMVRLGTLLTVRDTSGPVSLMRYNMYSAAAITGNTTSGTSSGQGIALMKDLAREELPRSMASDWTELTFLQLEAGNTAIYVFALAVVFVFLVLAAQYESWGLPLAVILVVPMCLLCSIVGVGLARLEVTIFTQIGFVVLVGLASKNAILIVEFAKQQQEQGRSLRDATLEAVRLRLRPILMTSFAFIFGVVPLVIATGAGAEMRQSLGLAVFSGMLGVTLFGIFLTPVFYYVIQWAKSSKTASATTK
ncbi:MAG TPA: efflux RND transporter permease subunit [Planctomycetaceae bacterium]|nr:efflux RND transporter permease subunit [Planctomycetaceae bacterium]